MSKASDELRTIRKVERRVRATKVDTSAITKDVTAALLPNSPARKVIHQVFEDAGLTIPYLVSKLKEGLDATLAWRHLTREGEVVQRISPDYAIRHKYLETAMRIREAFPVQDQVQQQAALIVQLPVSPSTTISEWNNMVGELKQLSTPALTRVNRIRSRESTRTWPENVQHDRNSDGSTESSASGTTNTSADASKL